MSDTAALSSRTFVAVVQYGDNANDRGNVWRDSDGSLYVTWPDGHADNVFRDARGWLWDEYGDDEAPMRRGPTATGTRLPVLSRRKMDMIEVLEENYDV